MYSKVKPHVSSPRPIKFVILYFHDVSGVCFVIRDEPYGVNPTLTVGPTIRLISILIHCVQHWPVIEPTLAQRLVFVLKWLHRPIPQPSAFGPSFCWPYTLRSCKHDALKKMLVFLQRLANIEPTLFHCVVFAWFCPWGGGPRVVVNTAAFHARVRGSVPGLGGLKETKMFLPIHV